jgi:hypothetical protein
MRGTAWSAPCSGITDVSLSMKRSETASRAERFIGFIDRTLITTVSEGAFAWITRC